MPLLWLWLHWAECEARTADAAVGTLVRVHCSLSEVGVRGFLFSPRLIRFITCSGSRLLLWLTVASEIGGAEAAGRAACVCGWLNASGAC